jgi:hypothetical protein
MEMEKRKLEKEKKKNKKPLLSLTTCNPSPSPLSLISGAARHGPTSSPTPPRGIFFGKNAFLPRASKQVAGRIAGHLMRRSR